MSDNSYSMTARCIRCKISAEQLMFATLKQMPDCQHYWVEPQQRYALPLPLPRVIVCSKAAIEGIDLKSADQQVVTDEKVVLPSVLGRTETLGATDATVV